MKYLIKSKNFYIDILVIIIGSFISSLGVNLFLSNAKLLSGGVTGIALILQYLWEVPSGITVFLLNIPLFFVSYKYLNKRFTLYTAIGMLSFSTALMITKPLSTLVQVDDMLLYCIYGGVLISKCIKSSKIIAYDDLGAEAIRKLEVKDMPLVVIIDTNGNNLYEIGKRAYLDSIKA